MKKYAVIDIGSNSVRLMFVVDGNVLYKQLQTTRLGEGLTVQPILLPQAIERTAKAVADFYVQAKNEGAEDVLCFATAAVRTAENRDVFLSEVQRLCGLEIEVITGEMEAEIGILGALGVNDGAVIDIGGASTEIVVKREGELVYKKSVDVGVVRLKDACQLDKNKLQAAAQKAAETFGNVPTNAAYAIGGTATALCAWYLGLQTYDAAKVTGTILSLESVTKMADELLAMSPKEICASSCMPKGRADVIAGGAVLLATLMKRLSWTHVIVSDRDNLEGYATKKGLKI